MFEAGWNSMQRRPNEVPIMARSCATRENPTISLDVLTPGHSEHGPRIGWYIAEVPLSRRYSFWVGEGGHSIGPEDVESEKRVSRGLSIAAPSYPSIAGCLCISV